MNVRVVQAPTRREALAGAARAAACWPLALAGATACAQRQTKSPVTLTWYSWGPQYPPQWTAGPGLNPRARNFGTGGSPQATPVPPEKHLEQQVAAFTADRDDVVLRILTERPDRYHDKLRALAAAGQLPDVVAYDGAEAMPLIRANVLYHLGRLQGSQHRAFVQRFPQAYLDATAYRGKLFGVPYQSRQMVLFVNKTAFGGTTLPPPEWGNPGWTWPQFLERASALTQRAFGGGYRQFGTVVTGRPFWSALIRQNGGQEFNREFSRSYYDVPEVYEAVQFAADLIHRYRVAPNEQQNPNGNNWHFDGGNVVMWAGFQHAVPLVAQRVYTAFEWDIYPLPGSKRTATYAEWGYLSVSANTVDVDRAWELARFLAGPEGDALALREGVAGPVMKGTESHFMVGSTAAKNKVAAIQATQQPMATRVQHDAWEQVRSLQEFYLRPVFQGTQKALYACRDLRLAVDGVLAGLESPRGPAVGTGAGDGGAAD